MTSGRTKEDGAAGKVAVFRILKRGGKVYTQAILAAKTDTLMPIIGKKIEPDSIVYTDHWRAHHALDISIFKHYRIDHAQLLCQQGNHINGIENFWSQAKRPMSKFNGIPINHFNSPQAHLSPAHQVVAYCFNSSQLYLSSTSPKVPRRTINKLIG